MSFLTEKHVLRNLMLFDLPSELSKKSIKKNFIKRIIEIAVCFTE